MFNVMSLRSMTFVTTRQNSNKFDFALAAPKVQRSMFNVQFLFRYLFP